MTEQDFEDAIMEIEEKARKANVNLESIISVYEIRRAVLEEEQAALLRMSKE